MKRRVRVRECDIRWTSPGGRLRGGLGCGKKDGEAGAGVSGAVGGADGAAVAADDGIDDVKAEAGVLAAGGEVGFEDAGEDIGGDTGAFVGDVDLVAAGLGEGMNRDDAAGWHRLGGVEEEVHKNTLPF